jgi:hypothetical protein
MSFRIHIGCSDFGFLVDITGHLNELVIFKTKTNSFTINNSIKVFQMKLPLREHELKANNYSQFPALLEVN